MNIFFLDRDPSLAAVQQCDKHIVKMPIEAAQMLCTALILDGHLDVPYRATHINHPCSMWVRRSGANAAWLWLHFDALCSEYTARYNRIHLVQSKMTLIAHLRSVEDHRQHTTPALAMPERYKEQDPVQAYRSFYKAEKSRFAKWKLGNIPFWW